MRALMPSDDLVTLRPCTKADARFIAGACTDPDIRRYNSVAASYPISDAEATVEDFAVRWHEFEISRRPSGASRLRTLDAT